MLGKYKVLSNLIKVSTLSFIAILAFGVHDFILPIFIESQAQSFAIVGLIISLINIASFFAEIPIGIAVDKYGGAKILSASMIVLSALGFVYYLTQNILVLALTAFAFGITNVAFWIPSTVIVRESSPRNMLSISEATYMTITQFGWILGPIVAGLVAAVFSVRHNFLLISAFMFGALVFGIIVLRKYKTKNITEKSKHKHKAKLTLLTTIFREYLGVHKHAGPLYGLTLAVYIWIAIQWAFVPLAGIERFNFTESAAGLILGAMMIVEGILYFSSGYIMDKIGKRYIITTGFLILFSSTYFMFLATSPTVFILTAMMSAGAVSWVLPGIEALLTEIVPVNLYGEMSGVFETSKDFGTIIGPLVAGILAAALHNPLTPFLFVALVMASAAILSGYIFWPEQKDIKLKLFAKN